MLWLIFTIVKDLIKKNKKNLLKLQDKDKKNYFILRTQTVIEFIRSSGISSAQYIHK